MITEKKWYKIAKKIVDILAYILAAVGGVTLLDSCNFRDAEPRVYVIKDNVVSRETTPTIGEYVTTEAAKELNEVVCEDCGATLYIEDVR